MPNKQLTYEPDWIDVNTQLTALGADFNARCEFVITVERDAVQCVARCLGVPDDVGVPVLAQALARRPIKTRPNLAVMCFSLAQDCWRQLDRGVLGAAGSPIAHSWGGRPHIARRSK
jgi:hypothetical protein